MSAAVPGGPRIADGTIEALKWLALASMVLDHVDRFLFDKQLGWSATAGRLAMPLFVFVLAHNLTARAPVAGAHARTLARMAASGALAALPMTALLRAALPLNIMFSLGLCVALAWALQALRERPLHGAAAVAAGLAITAAALLAANFVDYRWWILAVFAACVAWCRLPGWPGALLLAAALAALYPFERSFWPLLALPLILVAPHAPGWIARLPRIRYLFYVAYPLHLALLWAARDLA